MDIFDLLFPKKCLACSAVGSYLCASCLAGLSAKRQTCPHCDRPSFCGKTHTGCARKLDLDGHRYLWEYKGVVRRAILTMKYKFAFDVAANLAEAASINLKTEPFFPKKTLLLPIPTHPIRRNWRGFNQSEAVGKLLAQKMGWGYEPNLLVKNKTTVAQTELKRQSRLTNLQNVFSLNPEKRFSKKMLFLLFDDVWTTGSTLKEACKVLKEAGADRVWGLTLAKTN